MEEEEEGHMMIDMSGDMSDDEFEKVGEEIYERMKDEMYLIGRERIRGVLDKYRSELISVSSFEINYKFNYNGDTFSQILGAIRRGRKKT